jgi:hypothetical protein
MQRIANAGTASISSRSDSKWPARGQACRSAVGDEGSAGGGLEKCKNRTKKCKMRDLDRKLETKWEIVQESACLKRDVSG